MRSVGEPSDQKIFAQTILRLFSVFIMSQIHRTPVQLPLRARSAQVIVERKQASLQEFTLVVIAARNTHALGWILVITLTVKVKRLVGFLIW